MHPVRQVSEFESETDFIAMYALACKEFDNRVLVPVCKCSGGGRLADGEIWETAWGKKVLSNVIVA